MDKKHVWTCGLGIVLAGLTGSCQSSDVEVPALPEGGGTVAPVTYTVRPLSLQRASVQEADLAFRWDGGDRLTVWKGASAADVQPCVFETETGGLGSALFTHVGPETESRVYFGFYPVPENTSSRMMSLVLPADGIVQPENNTSLHLKGFRPMFTPVVTRDGNGLELTGLRFRHLTALWVFQVKNRGESPMRLRGITVEASAPVFHTQATYRAGSDADMAEADGPTAVSALTLRLGNDGFEVLPEGTVKAFLPLLPSADLSGVELKVVVETDQARLETLSLSGNAVGDRDGNGRPDFAPSYHYGFNLGIRNQTLQWNDNHIASWEEGEVTDIPVG